MFDEIDAPTVPTIKGNYINPWIQFLLLYCQT